MLTEIVSPVEIIAAEDCEFTIVPGDEGDRGIFDNHAPLITNLRSGLVYMYKSKKIFKIFLIDDGVCEITKKKCIILTESAKETKDLNENSLTPEEIKIIKEKYYS